MSYHVSQTLGYRNGYRIPTRPDVAVGGMTLPYNRLSDDEIQELANYSPTLTYGCAKQTMPEDFIPSFVAFDKKVTIDIASLITSLSVSVSHFGSKKSAQSLTSKWCTVFCCVIGFLIR